MPENFGFDDHVRNSMVFIEPDAQSHKNSRILGMLENFQYSRITILPDFSRQKFRNFQITK